MAQQFAFNGNTLTQGIEASWDDMPIGSPLAGGTTFNRFRLLHWQAGVLPADEFETIRGRLGRRVNVTTTDYDSPNGDFVTYYGATLDAVRGEHSGPNFVGVAADFTVRI